MTCVAGLARGLARIAGTVFLVSTLCWCLVEAAPGSLVERAARTGGQLPADPGRIALDTRRVILQQVAATHGLEGGPTERMSRRLTDLLALELGTSWRDGRPVGEALQRTAPATLLLWTLALSLALLLGGAFALAAARAPGGRLDAVLSALAACAFAVPPVWLALLALGVFADGHPWRLLPPEGLDSVSALILPVAVLACLPTFVVARHARAAFVVASRSPWAIAAVARGNSRDRVLLVHVVRASVGPLAALVPVLAAYLLAATMVVEEVFGIPGVGALLLEAALRGDAPVVVGVAALSGALVAMSSSVAEWVHRWADPRVRR